VLPDVLQLHLTYLGYTGRVLHLNSPQRFTEKMQAIKRSPLIAQMQPLTDKIAVRDFVAGRIGEKYLIPVHQIYNSPDEILKNRLPETFVMKCTHDSGSVVVCNGIDPPDFDAMIRKLKRAMKRDYFRMHREYNYKGIPPRILCEHYLSDEKGLPPPDFKFFCFNGEPEFIQVDLDRFSHHKRLIYGTDWTKKDFNIMFPRSSGEAQKPEQLDLMRNLARKLSAGFPFVRVDLYYSKGRIWFGELTFIHGAGYEDFDPDESDLETGRLLDISGYSNQLQFIPSY